MDAYDVAIALCDLVIVAAFLIAGATVYCALTHRGWWA